ncbi:unnamed protein product [Rhizoctonia solani]|uniref:Uncharacterized protein n=1 Tax=Rhizoctonia solani TaxID=456999 RepID=A0A8H3HDZ8_9AGAM|nr:unnamed protein product [Rhizoctonia solani]
MKARQREGRREEDAIQKLVDQDVSTEQVIGLLMAFLIVGINTARVGAWILILLDQNPEWKDKITEEIYTILNKHAPVEDGMPVLENCIKETIRLMFPLVALRQVVAGDTEIDGKKIPNGIYPNPTQFDPRRFSRE